MKRTFAVSFFVIAVLALMVGPATAGKPQNVIEKSNGFPSGPHSNLIIHGKNTEVFFCTSPSAGSNSVFVPEFTTDDLNGDTDGQVSIQYVQNKKADMVDLVVLDSCAIDDGLAIVQLPDKVMLDDGSTQPTDGFWVYAKIAGKPNNGNWCEEPTAECPSKIIMYPNTVVEACNDPGNDDFGDYTECPDDPDLALGVITNNLYVPDPLTGEFIRFDPDVTKGKGKSRAKDITRLFIYVGWVVDARVDITEDGVVDENDIPVPEEAWDIILAEGIDPNLYDDDSTWGNGNDSIDLIEEWLLFQEDMGMAWYFSEEDNTWMHEIADLVVTEQGLTNMGTKTLQVRFYPRSTTIFH